MFWLHFFKMLSIFTIEQRFCFAGDLPLSGVYFINLLVNINTVITLMLKLVKEVSSELFSRQGLWFCSNWPYTCWLILYSLHTTQNKHARMNAHHPHTIRIDLFSVCIQDPDVAKSLLGAKSQVPAMSSQSLKADLIDWSIRRLAWCMKDVLFNLEICVIQFLLTFPGLLSVMLIDCVVGCFENEPMNINNTLLLVEINKNKL